MLRCRLAARGPEPETLFEGSKPPVYIRRANERHGEQHVEEFEALGVTASGRVVCGDPSKRSCALRSTSGAMRS